MSPDGLSYLDIATDAIRRDWTYLINGYWSPLYPLLLALGQIVAPQEPIEITKTMHLVNWILSAATAGAFIFFLTGWTRHSSPEAGKGKRVSESPLFWLFAFSVLFWAVTRFHVLLVTTPDMCSAALVFLAAGFCVRLPAARGNLGCYAALGVSLGAGYYAKAAMLVGGLALLLVLALAPSSGIRRRGVLIAAAAFLVVCLPLVIMQSWKSGRLTIGEAGRLNYAWSVNHVRMFAGWQGGDGTYGRPANPPRKLRESPEVLEFSSPVSGSYPLWYDPSYWYDGVRPKFELRNQIQAVRGNLSKLWTGLSGGGVMPLLAGLLVLYGRSAVFDKRPWPRVRQSWMVLWPGSVCLLYLLVAIETRYVAAFFLLFILALYDAVLWRRANRFDLLALGAVAVALVLPLVETLPWRARAFVAGDGPAPEQVVARGLAELDIPEGARLATLGPAFQAYYARYLGARVVAQISSAGSFWALDGRERSEILGDLRSVNVDALIAPRMPDDLEDEPGWARAGASGFHYFDLR